MKHLKNAGSNWEKGSPIKVMLDPDVPDPEPWEKTRSIWPRLTTENTWLKPNEEHFLRKVFFQQKTIDIVGVRIASRIERITLTQYAALRLQGLA